MEEKKEWSTPEFKIILPDGNDYGIMTISDDWSTGEY